MAHWFDRLAEPHTRRTTLQAAALGGAALVLPLGRVSSAVAKQGEPCFQSCVDIATNSWRDADRQCEHDFSGGQARSYVDLLGGAGLGTLAFFLTRSRAVECRAFAELDWHRAVRECLRPECGDRGLYPGGNAPAVVCPDPGYVPCGPTVQYCCNTANAECQQCPGKQVCCRKGGNCCPSSG